jgi:tetratricopeptide (TPR) repeat protein
MLTELASTPISETIRSLACDRRSGDLQVRSGRTVKVVFFDHGRLVFAASNRKKDRLGEALVSLGRITDEQFQRVSLLMKVAPRPRFGDALVQAGVMDKEQVGRSVAQWVRRIILSLFQLEAGAASFEERQCPIPLEFMVSLSAPRILHDGILSMEDSKRVLAGIGSLDRTVTRAGSPPFPFAPEKCSPEEAAVLEQAKSGGSVRSLASTPKGISFPRLRATYALLASGVLRDAAQTTAPAAREVIATNTFLVSALERKPDLPSRDAIKGEVAEEIKRSEALDSETWLGIPRSAPREDLARALEQRIERYHGLRDAVRDDEELKTDIELLVGRANSMLRLARRAPSKPEAKPAEAPATPAAPAAPAAPAPAAPAPAAAEAAPATPTQHPEHLLMEANLHMSVGEYAKAISTYSKIVECWPKVAAYRVRLAVAMSRRPETARQAEREFLEAIRLEPGNADHHFRLGLYYKALSVHSRMIATFRAVVELDPGHKQARAELQALQSKDAGLSGLKRLLR